MAVDFAPLVVPETYGRMLREEWDRLARPGSHWTGAERVALASAARAARAGRDDDLPVPLPGPAREAAALLGRRPHLATRRWVRSTAGRLGYPRYVELVGVVARLACVDGFTRALRATPEPLPDPQTGRPSGETEPAARPGPAWVPMAGGASVTRALSLVPAESDAQERLHSALYLGYSEMDDLTLRRGLTRPQMELVAARVSAINECFY